MTDPIALALVGLTGSAVGFVLGYLAGRDDRTRAPVRRSSPRLEAYAALSRSLVACQACAEEYTHARIQCGQSPPARELIPNGHTLLPTCELCGCARGRYRLRIRLTSHPPRKP